MVGGVLCISNALVSASEAKPERSPWAAECSGFPKQFCLRAQNQGGKAKASSRDIRFSGILLVDLVGIEPTTSSMPWKRAPSCATGPHEKRCTRGLKHFNSRLLAIDSQTLWRLFASLVARQILGSGSVRTRRPHQGHPEGLRSRATAMADAGGAYPVRALDPSQAQDDPS
jgi:hypothetical protein